MAMNRTITRRDFLKGVTAGTLNLALMGLVGNMTVKASDIGGTEGPYGLVYADDQTLTTVYSSEITSLHPYASSGSATNWSGISNCVSGLLGSDIYGTIVGDMAETWDISDDGLVYTFHLREGMTYSDVDGNVVGEVVAQDFVTGAQYACNPDNASGSSIYFDGIIAGATALIAGEETDMDTLGFKALDDYTVEITLQDPLPYFESYCGSYIPVPTDFFNELGDSYGLDNESVYYYGAYIMTTYEPQSRRVYEKNPNYWDADNVYIEKITCIYNAESSTLAPEMFKRGEIDYASIGTDILDEWMTADDTKDIVLPSLPDTTYSYYYGFNFWPQFDEQYEPDNWNLAINNENFRQSLYWGLNRYKAQLVHDPYNPELYLHNTITSRTWCDVDGVDFVDIGDLAEIEARENYQFDEEKALEYKEKAVEELTAAGATFPVIMYMRYNPSSSGWEEEVQVVKQQLEDLLGSDYISCVLEAGPSTNFLAEVRRTGDYGFMKLNNGGSVPDPVAWTIAFAKGGTWNFIDLAVGEETQALLEEYYALVDEAKAVTSHSMERYEKFAAAEAFLLNHAFVIPVWCDTSGYRVTRYNPLDSVGNGRYIYLKMLTEPMPSATYETLYAEWQEERAAVKAAAAAADSGDAEAETEVETEAAE
ncbi:MAG: peptide ABC transporter substrate-binding protein [Lachnospiraceae bacterium]|nr:peptide ABC transporter substrate-binding protein [Lachnospiraceae bacterium]